MPPPASRGSAIKKKMAQQLKINLEGDKERKVDNKIDKSPNEDKK